MNRFTLSIILKLFCAATLLAQTQENHSIDPVNIELHLFKQSVQLDSLTTISPFNSVADILENSTVAQINNSGGRGAIQSLSIRGLTSSHNKIKWNGLQINSLTLGMLNLSGLSAGSFSNIQLYNGNTVWHDGEGAIGGALHLNNAKAFDKGLQYLVGTEFGSFGTYASNIGLTISKKKWVYGLSFSKEFVRNNYTYQNSTRIGNPTETLSNNQFWNTNIVQEIYGNIKGVQIKSVSWLTGKRQNTPPMLTERTSNTHTADSSFRQVVQAKFKYKKLLFDLTQGLDRQTFEYEDPDNNVFTYYITNNIQTNLETIYYFKSLAFRLKSNFQHQQAKNNNYEGNKIRNVNSNALNTKFSNKKKTFNTSLATGFQVESLNHTMMPILNWAYNQTLKGFQLKGGAGIHNRLPSFNDLFWLNGGNSDLNPENGWNIEQSISYSLQKPIALNVQFGGYYMIVDNWIQWLPVGNLWMPHNLKKVEAKGLEGKAKVEFRLRAFDMKLKHQSALTYTTVLESHSDNDPALGKQAINVPKYNSLQVIEFGFKKYLLQYRNTYTGLRFTSTDNDLHSALDQYWLSDLALMKTFRIDKNKLFTKVSVNNLFDLNYQVVGNRPMPGRAYYLTIQYKFN